MHVFLANSAQTSSLWRGVLVVKCTISKIHTKGYLYGALLFIFRLFRWSCVASSCKKGRWRHCFMQYDAFLLTFFVNLEKRRRIGIDDFQISDFLLDRFLFVSQIFTEPHRLLLQECNFLISLRSFLLTHTHAQQHKTSSAARVPSILLSIVRRIEE